MIVRLARPFQLTQSRDEVNIVLLLVAMMFVGLGLSGCTQKSLSIGGIPDDFSIEMLVIPADGVTSEWLGNIELPAQRSHYVLNTDGTLYGAVGSAAAADRFPTRADRLRTDDIHRLWNQARQLRFDDRTKSKMGKGQLIHLPNQGIAYVYWVRANSQEQIGRFESQSARPDDANLRAIVQLINDLHRLSRLP